MKSFSLTSALWILWFFYFIALEFYAVGTAKEGDTLTENVRAFFGTSYWFRLGVLALIVWLFFHFNGIETLHETWRKLFGRWL